MSSLSIIIEDVIVSILLFFFNFYCCWLSFQSLCSVWLTKFFDISERLNYLAPVVYIIMVKEIQWETFDPINIHYISKKKSLRCSFTIEKESFFFSLSRSPFASTLLMIMMRKHNLLEQKKENEITL